MSTTNSNEELSHRIEQLIQEHVAASRRCAQEAIARGFGSAVSAMRREEAPKRARVATGKKRASEDIAALGERFYAAVCAKPGETMTVLAAEVGASARELNRSMTLLKRGGRVRAVGSRHLTRYFPMNGAS
jgi:hypothetical protein